MKARLADHPAVCHPHEPRLSGLYGVIFHEPVRGPLHQRNVTVFADGEVDRSPCGSGTSARLAVLHHRGELEVGDDLRHDSIVGSTFLGRVDVVDDTADPTEVVTSIQGSAHRFARSTFELDPDDSLGLGFQLR